MGRKIIGMQLIFQINKLEVWRINQLDISSLCPSAFQKPKKLLILGVPKTRNEYARTVTLS